MYPELTLEEIEKVLNSILERPAMVGTPELQEITFYWLIYLRYVLLYGNKFDDYEIRQKIAQEHKLNTVLQFSHQVSQEVLTQILIKYWQYTKELFEEDL